MSRDDARQALIAFLDGIRRPESVLDSIADGDSLVESGLIDSLAVLEIMLYLETSYGVDFAANPFDPAELSTISEILNLIERQAA